jgi:tetratricopeptide (TPR) repeat protein
METTNQNYYHSINLRSVIVLSLVLFLVVSLISCVTQPNQTNQDLARDFAILGKGFYDQGNFVRAAELFQRAYELEPTVPGLRYNFARASIELGNVALGVQLLQEDLHLQPGNLMIIQALAFGLQRLGNHEEALALLLTYELHQGRAGAYNTAVAFFQTQRYQDGLTWFQTLPTPWVEQDQELQAIGAVLLGLAIDPEGAVLILENLPPSVMAPFFRNQLAGFYGQLQRLTQEALLREQLFQQSIQPINQSRRLAELNYIELGDTQQGFFWLQRAIAFGADPQEIEIAFKEFLSPREIDEIRTSGRSSSGAD